MSPWKSEGKNMVIRGKFCGKCVQESLGNLEFTHGINVAGNIK